VIHTMLYRNAKQHTPLHTASVDAMSQNTAMLLCTCWIL